LKPNVCVTQSDGIGAVVLAAGAPTRMDRAKQLLEFCGQSLITRAASVALEAGCLPVAVVLVTGANAAASRKVCVDSMCGKPRINSGTLRLPCL
jgi:CTP:molybdopterin cytidylyltransferase MocA